MNLTAYVIDRMTLDIRPAPIERDWMDATTERFAYRCLPLNIANAHGWEILNPFGFNAIWNGGPQLDAITIIPDPGASAFPISHFGHGALTFQIPCLFQTDPGTDLIFEAFFQKRDYPPALVLIEELVRLLPQTQRLRKALIVTLSNMRRYTDAIAHASQYIADFGEDLSMLDVLKVAYFYSGKTDLAIQYGQRVIEFRDAAACRSPPPMVMTEPRGRYGQKVISFSLWGAAAFYAYGAMINLILSRTCCPEWTCRFYVDSRVPRQCIAFLTENGADLRNIEDEYPGVGLFQRFLIMNDPTVEYFLVRDCDARLSLEEAKLVRRMDCKWIPVPRHARSRFAHGADDRLPLGRPH